MVNHKAGLKFAVKALPKLEAERLCVRPAGEKGQGVFLQDGVSIEKGSNVMIYEGRVCSFPQNDYCFKISDNSFLDASNAADCVAGGESC